MAKSTSTKESRQYNPLMIAGEDLNRRTGRVSTVERPDPPARLRDSPARFSVRRRGRPRGGVD